MVASRLRAARGNGRRRGGAQQTQRLSAAAVEWATRNHAGGVAPRLLVETLVGGGVARAIAERGVREIVGSNVTPALRLALARGDRAREILRLQSALRATGSVEELEACPSAAQFFARYWETNTPLCVRGFVERWVRPARWSFGELRRRFGASLIEAVVGRDARADPDLVFADLRMQMTLDAFLDRVEGPATNDTYVVARNRALVDGPMSALLEEIEPPLDLFDPATRAGGVSLWLGPAGTLTKLHHDATNNFFSQLVGRKRVRLIPPSAISIADTAHGFYARCTASDIEAVHAGWVCELTLEPGDGLFIPVGWWHEVESLTPSLSLALVNFRRPNNYDYLPGRT